jgi:ORF6N domain
MPKDRKQTGTEPLEPLILVVRGERVIIDADLARLYGVTTKRFNQAFKRNVQRFPADFAFQLSVEEFARLRSPVFTQPVDKETGSANWSQFVTSSRRHRGAVYRPWAFTEHGALMAANVLRSAQATQMSIFLIRAFVRLREEAMANVVVLKRLAQIDKTLLQHDAGLRDVYRKLQLLLAPPPETPKRRIGF